MIVTAEELAAIHAQAVREYPHESCGLILTRGGERRMHPCRNVQNELHAQDPQLHPRDARTAYYIAKEDLIRINQLDREGFEVAVIYHSHIDVGAYFSETDRRQALFGEEPTVEPTYPGVVYIVTSVRGGAGGPSVDDTAAFRWDPTRRDFTPVDLAVPALQGRAQA